MGLSTEEYYICLWRKKARRIKVYDIKDKSGNRDRKDRHDRDAEWQKRLKQTRSGVHVKRMCTQRLWETKLSPWCAR